MTIWYNQRRMLNNMLARAGFEDVLRSRFRLHHRNRPLTMTAYNVDITLHPDGEPGLVVSFCHSTYRVDAPPAFRKRRRPKVVKTLPIRFRDPPPAVGRYNVTVTYYPSQRQLVFSGWKLMKPMSAVGVLPIFDSMKLYIRPSEATTRFTRRRNRRRLQTLHS